MKKIRVFLLFILVTLLMSSCEENFDPQIYGKLFTANFPKTEADYEAELMACYIPFTSVPAYWLSGAYQHTWYYADNGLIRNFDTSSDYCAPATNTWGDWLKLSSGNFADFVYSGRNGSHFEKIRDITRFTKIIADIDRSTVLSDTKKKFFLGEARFLRGMMMYYLLHIYGPVPVVLDPALVGDVEAEKNMERPTLTQMVEWITADLEFGSANMATTAVKGRYTANYARFCLMRHYLNEGSYMAGYYDKAIDMYNALKSGGYELFTKGGATAYADQFKIANKFNKEVIMAVTCSETATGDQKTGNVNKYSYYFFPNNVARYADVNNTIPTPFVNSGPGWWQYYNVSPNYYKTYESGDVRKNVILTSYVINNTARTLVTEADLGSRWVGYILWKYPGETSFANQPTDIPIARWADVLLMYAEAVARKNKAVPTGAALQCVNDVRARAGLPSLSGDALASYNGFMDALLAERGHELLYEGGRKVDLIRFNKYRRICKIIKGLAPTGQYLPIPNYAVNQAESYGKTLKQFYERPDWALDN